MSGTNNVYVIYYANWGGLTQGLINGWLSRVGGRPLYGINTAYLDTTGAGVANAVNYDSTTNSYNDDGSLGDAFTDSLVQTIISNAIISGRFPADESGIYCVLTGTQVTDPGLCGNYIRYHWAFKYSNAQGNYRIKYAVVANVAGCPSWDGNIINGDSTAPNNSVAADGTIS